MHSLIIPGAYALVLSLFYFAVWRLPLNLTRHPLRMRIILGVTGYAVIFSIFSFLLPLVLMQVFQFYTPNIAFLTSSKYAFYTHGLFAALVCILPCAAWVDAKTQNNPVFQKKNNAAMLIWLIAYFFIPVFLMTSSQVRFEERAVIKQGFAFFAETYEYERLNELIISSRARTTSRKYIVNELILSFKGRDGSILEILCTEDDRPILAQRVAELIDFLKRKKITYTLGDLAEFPQWRSELVRQLKP